MATTRNENVSSGDTPEVSARPPRPVWLQASTGPPAAASLGRGTGPPGGGRAAAESMVLLRLGEAQDLGEPATQRWLSQDLRMSQATVSRILGRLQASGMIGIRPPSLEEVGRGERSYTLRPPGDRLLEAIRDGLRHSRWGSEDVTIGDLELLLSRTRLSALAQAHQQGLSARSLLESHRPEDDLLAAGGLPPGPSSGQGGGATTSPLIGRLGERLRLVRALRHLRSDRGSGQVLLLLGPAGAGKSRLLEFAQDLAQRQRVRVVSGRTLWGPRIAFSPFEEMLGVARPSTKGRSSPGPRGRPTSRMDRMLDYLRTIEELAQQGPLVLVADDLERATPSSLQVFQFLCTNIPRVQAPVLLLAAFRVEDGPPRPGGGSDATELLDRLSRASSLGLGVLHLGPLTPREAHVLARNAVGSSGSSLRSSTLLRQVVERSQGNPLFLLEGVREIEKREGGGSGARSPRGLTPSGPSQLPVSPTVRRLLDSRLRALPPGPRRVLEVAACIGEEFDAEPVVALAPKVGGPRPAQVAAILGALADRWQLLRHAGPSKYAFTHALFHELVIEDALRARRSYAVLAAWWETERPQDVLTIARFYHGARDVEHGLPWLERALEEVVRRQAHETAETYVRAIHDLLGKHPAARAERARRDITLANHLWTLGASRAAQRVLEVVVEAPLPRVLRWEAEASLLNALAATHPGEARERLDGLWKEVERSGGRPPPLLRAQLEATSAFLHAMAGEWQPSLDDAEKALQRLEGTEDWIWTTWAKVSRGTALLSLGRLEEALVACRKDRLQFKGGRFLPFLALTDNTEGRVRVIQGDWERAWRSFDEGFRLAQRVGNASVMATTLANRTLAESLLHFDQRARTSAEELLELSLKFDLPMHAAWGWYRRGQCLWSEGDRKGAAAAFQEAAQEFEELGLQEASLLPGHYLARLQVLRGDAQRGRAKLQEIEERLGRVHADELVPLEVARTGRSDRGS